MPPIDWKRAEDIILDTFDEMVGEFANEITFQIEDTKWDWPRVTDRRNGSTVYTPRDIVDTTVLRDSQEIHELAEDHAEIHYPVPYAAVVHEGTIIDGANGDIEIPARPFISEAVREYDPINAYADILRERLSRD